MFLFALNSADLGRTDLIEHEIDVGEHKTVRLPPRRISLHKLEAAEVALKEMEGKGVIRPHSMVCTHCHGPEKGWAHQVLCGLQGFE